VSDVVASWDRWNVTYGDKWPAEAVISYVYRDCPRPFSGNALDIGCGNGVNSCFLASEGYAVYGFDISPYGVTKATDYAASRNVNVEFACASIDCLPFKGIQFDVVICVGVFDCVRREMAAASLANLEKRLNVGAKGLFVFAANDDFRTVIDNEWQLDGFVRDEVEALFSNRFRSVYIDELVQTRQGGAVKRHDWVVTIEG